VCIFKRSHVSESKFFGGFGHNFLSEGVQCISKKSLLI